ncbi:MAG: glycine/betaine/sarcosine/D-proline family reductase selenoprotein B [Desulfarculus sp.]|nr:glycine/betaine/sarcosine/D-proline family reductase selenoprotein B [Pseudomonadota bacterium]MBV1716248.1 glycine/betaine/sarcosine/D-proline family reductase selenoprotein B [Desulfarculus sp.]MBU4574370.1 glycine/betaine/sarcosine/D-proline family reductase selenoprotein B [Pseudomonadota bacterium]MBU4599406.1 glycine/betaine/sarcosine/D-proline family reductase selenoprotein B [Pseudomonadota bacterium]MBV1737679.1 glycine/betaine/sarcosine/D-proline family reductase selenoprotein B [D
MARLKDLPDPEGSYLAKLPCPEFTNTPWVQPKPLAESRLAVISTAGLHMRADAPFTGLSGEYRVIPGDAAAKDLVMSHISANFYRSGFQQDLNVVLPLDRLKELFENRIIGSLPSYHYSFMGATDPGAMEQAAREVAGLLKGDRVDSVLLIPV